MADKEDRPEVRGGIGTEERQRKVPNPSERVLARRGGVPRGGPTPLAARGHAPPRGAAAAAAAMKTLGGFLTAQILVVDDQESNVRLLERLLARWGYLNVISTDCRSEEATSE